MLKILPNRLLGLILIMIFHFQAFSQTDLRISSISVPEPRINITADSVVLTIANQGLDTVNFNVQLDVTRNGGSILSQIFTVAERVTSGSSITFRPPVSIDFTVKGTYEVTAKTLLTDDTNPFNDEINAPVGTFTIDVYSGGLPLCESFESLETNTEYRGAPGRNIEGLNGWSHIGGRFNERFLVIDNNRYPQYIKSGSKAVVLDAGNGSDANQLILTTDLSAYDTAQMDSIRLFFTFGDAGDERDFDDQVYFRTSLDSSWIALYNWGLNGNNGQLLDVKDLNIDSALRANDLQFSSSFQILFQQFDNFPINTDGFTLDDVILAKQESPVASNQNYNVSENLTEGQTVGTFTVTGGSGKYRTNLDTLQKQYRIDFDGKEVKVRTRVFYDYEALVASGATSQTFDLDIIDDFFNDTTTIAINVVIANDNLPAFTVEDVTASIEENTALNTVVTQVTPAGGSGTYSAFLSGENSGLFSFNRSTNEISVAKFLDFEVLAANSTETQTLNIQLVDSLTREVIVSTVTIDITDDGLTALTVPEISNSIAENSTIGTSLGLFAPVGGSGNYEAKLTSIPSDQFSFNTENYEISITGPVDFETAKANNLDVQKITVSFTDLTTMEVITSTATITITDDGLNTLALSDQTISVAENTASGTSLITLVPEGGSGNYQFEIISPESDLFEVDLITLEISTKSFIDYEAILPSKRTESIVIKVTDSVTKEEVTGAITLTVTNDGFTSFRGVNSSINISENVAADSVVTTIRPEGGSLNWIVSSFNTPDNYFTYNEATSEITTSQFLDYEKIINEGTNIFTFEVTYTDEITKETAVSSLNITVTNDGLPQLNVPAVTTNVKENTLAGTFVTKIEPMGGSGNYTIGVVSQPDALFSFNPENNEISVTEFLDFEALETAGNLTSTFEISYTDQLTAEVVTSTVSITVTDDGLSALAVENQSFSVEENTRIGTIIGRLNPTGGSGTYDVSFTSSSDLIKFDPVSLAVLVDKELDFEALSGSNQTSFSVEATFTDITTLEVSTATLLVTVTDVDETPEVVTSKTEDLTKAGFAIYAGIDQRLNISDLNEVLNRIQGTIYSLDGKAVSKVSFTKTSENSWMSEKSFRKGFYIIQLSTSKGLVRKKLLIN